ncbi:hypothetical protein J437_LFUL014678 [Ladona fulva]|uniref:Uncharacterized protein n=1 Tax=Ladona fulva TaxID=123851 RepID=A0A8K0KMS6_LADFU|nr:hypothetical protein J437_LFUL014678 [Ladona fulva]
MLVPLILTEEEYARVPEDIAKKIDDYIGTKAENFKRFKDFHDKTQAESEERVLNLENIVSESQRDLTDTKKEAEVAQRKIEELQTNLKEVKNELDTLQELSKR